MKARLEALPVLTVNLVPSASKLVEPQTNNVFFYQFALRTWSGTRQPSAKK